ncbi:snoRNA-binding rRNA-processing protein [Dimargaris xerosporica]|nr:snoRNA-binding rRNA-processing protein [Dimargaris xerosporica]
MGRAKSAKKPHQEPLYASLARDESGQTKRRQKYVDREREEVIIESGDQYLPPRLTQKILQAVKNQQREVGDGGSSMGNRNPNAPRVRFIGDDRDIVSNSDDDAVSDEDMIPSDDEYDPGYDQLEVDEADQTMVNKFLPDAPGERQTLADIIMAKIEERNGKAAQPTAQPQGPTINAKVTEVYRKVGEVMSRYRAGPVPKAFKIIPSIPHWQEILYLTNPDGWTPHATFQAVRTFIHGGKIKDATKVLEYILLDKVRDDIGQTKKLNYHLYMALKKALFRPEAFFKGILFPLCKSQSCTLREAVIISSVIAKVSIPALHSSSALLKLTQLDYSGPTSLFIRVLLDKKYALPYKVVDGLVFHFLRFKTESEQLPVLWHQSLLTFVQRYKSDLTPDQKEALLDLLKYQNHDGISPEVRRELHHSACRGEMLAEPMMMDIAS